MAVCRRALDGLDRLRQTQLATGTRQSLQQGSLHIQRTIARRKDFTADFHFRRHALGFDQLDQLLRAESRQRRVQEATLSPKRLNDPCRVGGVCQIAAGSARHQDLDARLAVLLQQQRPPPTLGSSRRRQQSCRARSHDDDVPMLLRQRVHELPTACFTRLSAICRDPAKPVR